MGVEPAVKWGKIIEPRSGGTGCDTVSSPQRVRDSIWSKSKQIGWRIPAVQYGSISIPEVVLPPVPLWDNSVTFVTYACRFLLAHLHSVLYA